MIQQRKRGQYAERPRFLMFTVVWIAIALAASGFYLYTEWYRDGAIMANEATVLAGSLEMLLHPEHVSSLAGTDADIEKHRYDLTKASLIRLAAADNDIEYAFLVAAHGDKIVFLADSLDASDPTAAAPGDAYAQATDAYWTALSKGESAFIPEITDARGTWVRTLVPFRDVSGATIALFGIDYDAHSWYQRLLIRMRSDFVITLSLILLSIALIGLYTSHKRLKSVNGKTASNEALLSSVFDQAPIGVAVSSGVHVVSRQHTHWLRANQRFGQILGRTEDELAALKWDEITMPDEAAQTELARFFSGARAEFSVSKEYVRPDGRHVWLNLILARLSDASFEGAFLCIIEDITHQRAAEAALREAERSKAVLLSHLPGMAYRCRFDRDWTMEFVSEGCVALTGYQPDDLIENRVISYNNVIAPDYQKAIWAEWEGVAARDESFQFEYEIVNKSGERRWVYEVGQTIRDASGEIVALEGIIIDITDRKAREQEVAYLSVHDHLTGLYDRRFILEAAARLDAEGRLPVSVAVCDINGVRVVNFAFGNKEGDRLIADVGKIIASCGRDGDLVGRTGGDEFTLILPGASLEEAARVVKKIEGAIERYNRADRRHLYEVSLSIGFDAKLSKDARIEQVMKTAGESLMHAKLLNRKSSHSALLSSIMAALYARNQETEEHGQRLARYARMIGEALDLTSNALDEMQLLSMLHDIGKIGIDDRVLMKPSALTPEEREEMEKHSEIGHRIALSSPELTHIADYILHHHEKWDGTGYPARFAGEQIPLPSRILAVCDAYDAMTENRVYRRAMPKKDALREIARCAGTQFDPAIAHLFIALMEARGEASA